jgi:hypothetical protein
MCEVLCYVWTEGRQDRVLSEPIELSEIIERCKTKGRDTQEGKYYIIDRDDKDELAELLKIDKNLSDYKVTGYNKGTFETTVTNEDGLTFTVGCSPETDDDLRHFDPFGCWPDWERCLDYIKINNNTIGIGFERL